MNRFDNPFHDLWVTEILAPTDFVKMFSPYVVAHSEELFGTGNVVIKGRQGSGKSMLLSLLNTRTRIAYARANEVYPAPEKYKNFIAAGIHLIRDNARIVASRLLEIPPERRKDWAATTFADYINYLLVEDLLHNIIYLFEEQSKDGVLKSELPIAWNDNTKLKLVKHIKSSDAWFGYLDDCKNIDDIIKKISKRLIDYRKYFNFNTDKLDSDIEQTKTRVGEPAAIVADSLRLSGIIPQKALVFLRIDQHEELYELEKSSDNANIFRRVINQAIAMRDGRVAYRIGTRHYAWNAEISVWGSGAHLENMRDFSTIDIDEMFKRKEQSSLNAEFGDFAEDVFKRRLSTYGFELDKKEKSLLTKVFGTTLSTADRARAYVKKKESFLQIPESWSDAWKNALQELWKTDPLDAKLGEVWLRQRKQQSSKIHLLDDISPYLNWGERVYWKKERNEAALVQIAGDAREMLIWSGQRHIIDLSGYNILAFMTICRAVWAAWLRSTPDDELAKTYFPKISMDKQIIGINEASRIWAEKLKEGTDGDRRLVFINCLGSWFSSKIRADKALSNPGHNGISLLKSEFIADTEITTIIRSCRDHGDLIESDHTTKLSDGFPRIKWYLNPLLSPHFRIPHIRTKEPIYTSVLELENRYKGRSSTLSSQDKTSDSNPFQTEIKF
ncbi:ORC-CDC6 family AAA ATPase [Pseudomonas syringae]|uniref:ORC-CDC6 family AAA ATPase n=1 Tax=Pseudomonas syringae TaxID=317 RepID=UPI0002098C93|nr:MULTISPECIES: hypothetical protein [Pseudomonas syringae group]EGH96813.1 hypothetical protein PLA106_11995 [Pseudomonas amygdali pv. lachrymans str. M302278]KPC11925.1 Uncharacterized protein AC500_0736 [Pseudomonas amygdali pv. lachrymans]RMM09008.1 hypothetical protein ALQ85_102741 [Pseudomonas syringae]